MLRTLVFRASRGVIPVYSESVDASEDYTAQGLQTTSVDLPPNPEEERQQEWERRVALKLAQLGGIGSADRAHFPRPASSGRAGLNVDLKLRSPKPIPGQQVRRWKAALEKSWGSVSTWGWK